LAKLNLFEIVAEISNGGVVLTAKTFRQETPRGKPAKTELT